MNKCKFQRDLWRYILTFALSTSAVSGIAKMKMVSLKRHHSYVNNRDDRFVIYNLIFSQWTKRKNRLLLPINDIYNHIIFGFLLVFFFYFGCYVGGGRFDIDTLLCSVVVLVLLLFQFICWMIFCLLFIRYCHTHFK